MARSLTQRERAVRRELSRIQTLQCFGGGAGLFGLLFTHSLCHCSNPLCSVEVPQKRHERHVHGTGSLLEGLHAGQLSLEDGVRLRMAWTRVEKTYCKTGIG